MRNPIFDLITSVRLAAVAPFNREPLEEHVGKINEIVAEDGKLSQAMVRYSPVPVIPPVLWDYRCSECRVFEAPGSCEWVEGDINEDGWCTLWVPPEQFERPFTWTTRLGTVPGIFSRSAKTLFDRFPSRQRSE